jgi:hypothetical protein
VRALSENMDADAEQARTEIDTVRSELQVLCVFLCLSCVFVP